jgi:hypothetical protein
MTTDYNGWTNRETWATALHINNDQWLQELADDYAQTAHNEHKADEEEEMGASCDAVACLADTLESWISEDLLTLENISANPFTGKTANEGLWMMLNDIGSLYRVNWRELAEAWLSDIKEEEK